ncbi:N-acetylglucosamine kinase [Grimontia hollisae]|uniref:N-acetyl-D-glucosamine kinase n=2 Tax=Grimontia hollisae TaxID=673 RepID=D0IAK3_GRIHO|nr:N-acetylglucosamine kinase [Grimontia hollisae]AUW37896.1 N-acetylglucosamine kinase [Grimontia hollisae]EEY70921.1 ROK family protein [Grimontia hollisae CIP 101886]MDF2186342.1 N-acetylglucosamine kinase [Grimontia hollisae]STO44533.1 N-acetyl-D-glucosamine kinase [Grimontia hollisae]STO57411.1 N-acetyl-D-glucosamine kinase [Grimontia hollisae]
MYYGFDVGGTKIEFGAFDNKLTRLATERVPTPGDDYEQLIDTLAALVMKYDQQFGCEGTVGIGIPGIEKAEDGTVLTVNVPAAKGRKLREDLQAKIGRTVALNNDANCFALSEAWDEELQGEKMVLGLILGTGFGGGLIVDGKVLSGKNNVAGELGHMRMPIDAWLYLGENAPIFDCGCDKKGCIDNYLSGRGFEMLYTHFYGEEKKAIDIIHAFNAGESKASEFVDKYIEMLAMVFAGLFTGIDPDVVVLGGGLSNFDYIYDEMPKRVPKYLLSVANVPKIIKAKHGDSGGVRGAAFLNIHR